MKSKSTWIGAVIFVLALLGTGFLGHELFYSPHGKTPAPTSTKSSTDPLRIDLSCTKKERTQVAMDECAGKVEAEALAVLKAALVKERSVVKPALVNAAQKEWTAYATTQCTAYAAINEGGSIQPFVFSQCEYQQTVERVHDVRGATRYASN